MAEQASQQEKVLVPFQQNLCPSCDKKTTVYGTKKRPEGTIRFHTCDYCYFKFKSIERKRPESGK